MLRALIAAIRSSIRDDLLTWSASLAFYFLFAFFPLILLAAALLGAFHLERLTINLVFALMRDLPRPAAVLVATQLHVLLAGQVPGLLSLDVFVLLYSASQAFSGFMAALNAAYELKETRSWPHRVAVVVLLTVSAGLLIAAALIVPLLGHRLLVVLAGPLPRASLLRRIWPLLQWAVALSCMMLAMLMLYHFAPSTPVNRHGRLGAVSVAILLWLLASLTLSLYVDRFTAYSSVYGSLGAVVALMLWFYLFALAILFGAEFHHAWLKQGG